MTLDTTTDTTDSTGTASPGTEVAAAAAHHHGYISDKDRYLTRMKRIEGQARGIAKMIDDEKYCIDILTQIAAVNSALENVAMALLDDHLHHCVAHAASEGGEVADEKLSEAMAAIKRLVKS